MFGLEELPLPLKVLIAIIFDAIDAFNIIPEVGDLIETPINAFIAYALTDNPRALAIGAVDGILPAPFDFFPSATAVVLAEHFGVLG